MHILFQTRSFLPNGKKVTNQDIDSALAELNIDSTYSFIF